MTPKIVHESWAEPLKHLWTDPRLKQIQSQLQYMKFTPEARNIFRAFSMPYGEVRIVITALSPYKQVTDEGVRFATGLAMGTPGLWTRTLDAVIDCLNRDLNVIDASDLDTTLEHWHNQGILLLNKALTVTVNTNDAREHIKPFTHKKGWEWFTLEVIKVLNRDKTGLVFVFLGKDAQEYAKYVSESNHVIKAVHPVAREYAFKKNKGYVPNYLDFGKSGTFRKIDDIIENINGQKITWYEARNTRS